MNTRNNTDNTNNTSRAGAQNKFTFSQKYTQFLNAHRKKLTPLIMLVIVFFGVMLFQLKFDLSTQAFLFPNDKRIAQYNEYQYRFGLDGVAIIAITGDVFSNEYLVKVDALEKEILARVPYIKQTTSIINVSQLYTETDDYGLTSLYVDDLLKDFPEKKLSEGELAQLKSTLLNDPVFVNRVISKDGASSAIVIELDSKAESELVSADSSSQSSTAGGELNSSADNAGSASDSQATSSDLSLDSLFDDIGLSDSASNEQDADLTFNATKQETLSNEQSTAVYNALYSLKAKYNSPDFTIAMAGGPLLIPSLIKNLLRDALIFLPMLLLMILVLIKILLKRVSAIVFTMIVASFTNVFILGLMALTGTPITIVANILPTLMISIGIGAVIHLLVLVFQKFDEGLSKPDALEYAFSHSGWPIILTSLTSAAGIFSFYFSSVKPLRDFAIFGSLGLLFSLFLTVVLLPLFILNLPIKKLPIKENKESMFFDKLLSGHAKVAIKFRVLSLILTFIIIGISLLGVNKVYFSHKPVEWLPLKSEFRNDTKVVDNIMNGSNFLEIFIDTKQDGTVYEPSFLNKLETLETFIRDFKSDRVSVGNVLSLNSLVKKTHKVLNNDDQAFYTIPDTRQTVAQELLLLENGGGDTLSNFVDLNYRYLRMSIVLPDLDVVYFSKLLDDVDAQLDTLFKDDGYRYYTTGEIGLLSRVLEATIHSAGVSYLIAFVVITILMILLTSSIRVGFISMLPNILPVFVLLGIVGFTTINLDLFILLVGCVLLGIAVDNTIHFIHVSREYLFDGKSIEEAIRMTFLTTGKAMLTSSLVLIAGFGVLIFARMRNFHNFGVLAVVGVLVALFADFYLTPSLVYYMSTWEIIKKKDKKIK